MEFWAVKDLGTLSHVEALTPTFGETFWKFIKVGGNEVRQASDSGKPNFYHFQKPIDNNLPVRVELFLRAPATLQPCGHPSNEIWVLLWVPQTHTKELNLGKSIKQRKK